MKSFKRWDGKEHTVMPNIDSFLDEIIQVCKKHNLSISHEDNQGAFIIEKENEGNYY